ncbi:MAG: hypothetical protein HZC14_03025 [Candidatus Niyogibacteria bacterium]|nr:hypothetical protein [Candidatus Niyogibacteria bacterium]
MDRQFGKEKARREWVGSKLKNAAPIAIVPFKDGLAAVTAKSHFRKVRAVDQHILFAATGEYESVNILHSWLVEDVLRIIKTFSERDVFMESVVDNPDGAIAHVARAFYSDPVVAELALLFAEKGKFFGVVINSFGERKYLDGDGAVIGGKPEMGELLTKKLREAPPSTEKEAVALAAEVLKINGEQREWEVGVLSGSGIRFTRGGE